MAKVPPSSISNLPSAPTPVRQKAAAARAGAAEVRTSAPRSDAGRTRTGPVVPSSGKGMEIQVNRDVGGHGHDADDFEPSQVFGVPFREESLPVIPPNPPGDRPRSGLLELLDEAEDPGVFFREQHGDGAPDDEEDSELDEAVEEAIRLLFGVRGIHHIGPGEDADGHPVVLISANTGFSAASLAAVPPEVLGFKTLLALPYELLPLRRERP